jgi:predicted nucleotide-binding protein
VSTLLDQQFVVHVFVPARGPDAEAGFRALDEIWRNCGLQFGMNAPIPGISLPRLLTGISDTLPADGEFALAAQERPGADCQAVLRLHHDLLNLSIALAPPETSAPGHSPSGDEDWPWWQVLDEQWSAITSPHDQHLLGEARLYLARVNAEADVRVASEPLYERLSRLLPAGAADPHSQSTGVVRPEGVALWETRTAPDSRAVRRFVLAIAPHADDAASAWVWSQGDPVIPPLARYLLHAAKIRYEMRVWHRDSQARRLRASLDALTSELTRLGAAAPAKAELLRLTRLNATLLHADLRDLRQTVEIAADNLGRAFDVSGLMAAGTPFADDAGLARYLLEQLDDEVAYLGRSTERAEQVTGNIGGAAHGPAAPKAEHDQGAVPAHDGAADPGRNVFVVYGRDESARRALFEFLRSLGLRPLEWEAVVEETGKGTPLLGEAVRKGLAAARAVVVLLTPEDVVRLHPDLHEPHEATTETRDGLQARPNVLLELGMALITHPDRTLVLVVGKHRPVTDLGGLNFIRVNGTIDCRRKIASRLKLAGCPVDDTGQDWLHAGDFAGLAALRRSV